MPTKSVRVDISSTLDSFKNNITWLGFDQFGFVWIQVSFPLSPPPPYLMLRDVCRPQTYRQEICGRDASISSRGNPLIL